MGLTVDIKKKLGSFTLEVSLASEKGIMGILGASGCGKSMTLKCIAGIETPDTGKIVLNGRVLFDSEKKINLSPQMRHVGYLFQNYALFPNMTVEENIAAGAKIAGKEKEEKIAGMIAAFYLTGLEKKRPSRLSGGQQQRVALARLLLSSPEIILLDEPFSALDSHLKWKLERELYGVVKGFDGLTLMVSHNRDEIYRMCERFAVISQGRIDTLADRKTLFKNPKTLAGALLTGCKNVTQIQKINDTSFFAADWGVVLHTAQKISPDITHAGIRRHYLYYAAKTGEDSEENVLELTVADEIENPFAYIVLLKSDGGREGERGEIQWEVGKSTWERIKGPTVRVVLPKDRLLLLKSNEVNEDE